MPERRGLRRLGALLRRRRPVTRGFTYAPRADGFADPGEVVWAWVAYEDDPAQGKDRPVVVLGREGTTLVALMMTSKDHDRDAAAEARAGSALAGHRDRSVGSPGAPERGTAGPPAAAGPVVGAP
jgi:hypothetical protein